MIKTFFKKHIAFPSELRKAGILGINQRNAEYILPLNLRKHYPKVDDKTITKSLCQKHGINIPETYHIITSYGEVKDLANRFSKLTEFVIKPASGSGGRGIQVISGQAEGNYIKANGTILTLNEIRYHVITILSGLFSLGGQPDKAIVESRIKPHAIFSEIAVDGTPDIRVIVFKGIPIMAMVRLPTALSGGRANLHQGAIAAGIDLISGITRGGVFKNQMITHHPETQKSISGIEIPFWKDIITMSAKLFDILKLGYFGADFVLDADQGPVLLEANARPGLAIQIANKSGLQTILEKIKKEPDIVSDYQTRLDLIPKFI